jgi:cellobiose-specific phosphotransferase system component IIA
MDEQWQRKEAAKAADSLIAQADDLLTQAHAIYDSIDHDVSKANVSEARVYLAEILEP